MTDGTSDEDAPQLGSEPAGGNEQRIVVGVDGSSSSRAALSWAVRQAQLTGSRLQIVTTWDWPINFGWTAAFPPDYDPAADASKMLDATAEALRSSDPSVEIRTLVVEGHPAPALVEASVGADLLVVGSRGHGQFAGMLLGSVSEHCVTNAHCPVLVMRGDPDSA